MAYIELDRSSYFHNLSLLANRAGGVDKLAVVLKDNAYGHGIREMAELASEFGIKKVVVKDEHEASIVSFMFDMTLILLPDLTTNNNPNFSYVINSLEELKYAKKGMRLHLKIDTGMHRNGIEQNQITKAVEIISKNQLTLEGVMTHFRGADDLNGELFWQMRSWKRIKDKILKLLDRLNIPKPLFHSFASSSLLRAKMDDDFARCGIATYGYSELHPAFGEFDLATVLTLWGERISSRRVKQGQRVGYGGVGYVDKDCMVSTYDVGYGDGFFRYDGKGKLKIDDYEVIGRISMDNTSLICNQEKVRFISNAFEISKIFDTISYDVLVKLSSNIKRDII